MVDGVKMGGAADDGSQGEKRKALKYILPTHKTNFRLN